MARKIDTTAVIEWIRLKVQGSNPASPAANYFYMFVKSTGLYTKDSSGNVAGPLITPTFTFGFHVPGTLTAVSQPVRILAPYTGTITNVTAAVNTAPTGADLIIDVNNGGTTIFSNQANRPTVAAAGYYDTSSVPDVVAVTQNDVFTLDIDQIGSTVAGADLNVQIRGVKS